MINIENNLNEMYRFPYASYNTEVRDEYYTNEDRNRINLFLERGEYLKNVLNVPGDRTSTQIIDYMKFIYDAVKSTRSCNLTRFHSNLNFLGYVCFFLTKSTKLGFILLKNLDFQIFNEIRTILLPFANIRDFTDVNIWNMFEFSDKQILKLVHICRAFIISNKRINNGISTHKEIMDTYPDGINRYKVTSIAMILEIDHWNLHERTLNCVNYYNVNVIQERKKRTDVFIHLFLFLFYRGNNYFIETEYISIINRGGNSLINLQNSLPSPSIINADSFNLVNILKNEVFKKTNINSELFLASFIFEVKLY